MRRSTWLAALALVALTGATAQAQQDSSLSNFGVGAKAPSHIIDPPAPPAPPQPIQQVPSPSKGSIFPNWLPKLSFKPLLSLFSFGHNGPAPALPGMQPDAYGPLLPTTQLPTPPPNAYNPVLPTTTLPAPQYPDAFKPLPPINEN